MKKRFFRVTIVFENTTVVSNVYTEKDIETFTGIVKAFAIAQDAIEFSIMEINIISDDILFNAMSKAI